MSKRYNQSLQYFVPYGKEKHDSSAHHDENMYVIFVEGWFFIYPADKISIRAWQSILGYAPCQDQVINTKPL